MGNPGGVDFYQFDRNLSDEERGIRDTVRRFVDDKFLPGVRQHFQAGTFPLEIIPELGTMGLLGSSIQGPGCPGMSGTVYGLICRELERGDSGLRSFASVQGSLVMWPIATYGTDEFSCGRHMANLESVITYEGTHDIHTLIVGADITGLQAFR